MNLTLKAAIIEDFDLRITRSRRLINVGTQDLWLESWSLYLLEVKHTIDLARFQDKMDQENVCMYEVVYSSEREYLTVPLACRIFMFDGF